MPSCVAEKVGMDGAAVAPPSQVAVPRTAASRLLRHVSGEWRWMRVHRVPLRDAAGVLTGWVGMNKDITEEKKAKEQLELVNSELSHRIKNLLSIIIAIAQESGKRANRIDEYLVDFRSRLEGLARSHDLLMKGRWEAVDLDELSGGSYSLRVKKSQFEVVDHRTESGGHIGIGDPAGSSATARSAMACP